jgi:hypothetical protein
MTLPSVRPPGRSRRRAVTALALLCAVAFVAPALDAQQGGVRGQVRSGGNGEALAGAVVEVVAGERTHTTMAGARGEYAVSGVRAGRRMVRATHIGHAPLEIEVLIAAGRDVEVDLVLPVRPVALDPVQVEGGRYRPGVDTLAIAAPDLSIAGARAIQSSPGISEMGLAEAVRGIPGQEPADPSQVLYVRGAATDLKLVYLDGAPVYAPFPLGGLLEAFTPGLLSAADVYVGGAPARYDGGLSYVLDLRTRGARSDRFRTSGAVDMLSGRATVELPLGERVGVLASGRSVHGLGATTPLPYGYGEGMLRGDVRLGFGSLSATAFRNRESVSLSTSSHPDSAVAWGNLSTSARFATRLGGQEVELTAALGEYQARLPLESPSRIVAEGRVRRARFAADASLRLQAIHLRYGMAHDGQSQMYRGRSADDTGPSTWASAEGAVTGAYVDAAGHATDRLRLRGGLRMDHFSLGGSTRVAPRLAATWMVTDRAALTVAGGRYHQYLRAPESALLAASGLPQFGRSSGPVPPLSIGRATHATAALDQDLGDGLRLGVEGYFKDFQGLPGSSTAEAHASGVDLWMRRNGEGLTGWAGYSLGWVWSSDRGAYGGNSFSGRHMLSAGASAPIGERSQINASFAYGAGLPYAAIPMVPGDAPPWPGASVENRFQRGATGLSSDAPPLIPSPERAFLRLDLAASRSWTPTLFGTRTEIASYLKVLNTLGRRDALFYRFDRRIDDAPRAVDALPIVPVAGVEWRF